MKLSTLTDKAWPHVDRPTSQDQKEIEDQRDRAISQLDRDCRYLGHDLLLEEARRLYEEEEERKKAADSKATTYLLVAAALVPVLTYFEGVVWGDKVGSAPRWAAFSIISLAIIYLAGFTWYAFRTLKLVAYYRIGTTDVVGWVSSEGVKKRCVVHAYLTCTRKNQDANNMRLTWLGLAHRFILRVFICFAAVCLLEAGYGVRDAIVKSVAPPAKQVETTKQSGGFMKL